MDITVTPLTQIDLLPKRFHWINTYEWTRDSFIQGRSRLEKLTNVDNDSFFKIRIEFQRFVINYQNYLDSLFYWNDLAAFESACDPKKLGIDALRKTVKFVFNQRRVPRNKALCGHNDHILRRTSVAAVSSSWYVRCLETLLIKKDTSVRQKIHDFLTLDYNHAQCKSLLLKAYFNDLKHDPEYAPLWLAELALRFDNSCSSDNTDGLAFLINKHPNPNTAWQVYFKMLFTPCIYNYNNIVDNAYNRAEEHIWPVLKQQIAYFKSINSLSYWENLSAIYQAFRSYLIDQQLTDENLSWFDNLGKSILINTHGESSLQMLQILDISVVDAFKMIPTEFLEKKTLALDISLSG